MKKILSLLALSAVLMACTKEASLEEKLAGTWNLNDVAMNGSFSFAGQAISFTGQDSLIRPNNTLDLVYVEGGTHTFTWNQDVRVVLNVMGQSMGDDIVDNSTGTWYAVDGGGATADSLYMTSGGETIGFEMLSFLETSMRIRSQVTEVDPTLGSTTVSTEYGFDKP